MLRDVRAVDRKRGVRLRMLCRIASVRALHMDSALPILCLSRVARRYVGYPCLDRTIDALRRWRGLSLLDAALRSGGMMTVAIVAAYVLGWWIVSLLVLWASCDDDLPPPEISALLVTLCLIGWWIILPVALVTWAARTAVRELTKAGFC